MIIYHCTTVFYAVVWFAVQFFCAVGLFIITASATMLVLCLELWLRPFQPKSYVPWCLVYCCWKLDLLSLVVLWVCLFVQLGVWFLWPDKHLTFAFDLTSNRTLNYLFIQLHRIRCSTTLSYLIINTASVIFIRLP